MENESFQVVERDGDVISRADSDSAELTLREPFEPAGIEDHYGFTTKVAEVANKMVAPEAVEVNTPSAAAVAYDRASELVERRTDQGLDAKAAWEEADPTGDIRRNWERAEQARQNEINRTNTAAIRQQLHDAKVAEIEKIYDPAQRAQALRALLAEEQAAAERRGRRA